MSNNDYTTIITQTTTDPNMLKFFPGRKVYESGVVTFHNLEDCISSPVATKLLELDDVQDVSFCNDFVLVTKETDADWEELRLDVLLVLSEFNDRPYFQESGLVRDDSIGCKVEQVLHERVAPVLASDGGKVVFLGWKDGKAYVHLTSACSTCPRAGQNLLGMITRLLKHYVPEIKSVVLA